MDQIKHTCGCCEGAEKLTPMAIANRPGLSALAYRAGTHAGFFETMKARLSNYYLDIPAETVDQNGRPQFERLYPLQKLTTRAANDPAIALLDAWATIGDVLTFYQERIANEGFLRTATERRSILDLARLVGYSLRPGVASTVYLAYTLDSNFKEEVIIPVGARSQSVPGPGELPQTFETSEPLQARTAWNRLQPRMTQPQTEASIFPKSGSPRVYLKGISTNLKPNDPLLVDFGGVQPEFFRILEVKPEAAADRTLVRLQPWTATTPAAARPMEAPATVEISAGKTGDAFDLNLQQLVPPPSVLPASKLQLQRNLNNEFAPKGDAGLQLVAAFQPKLSALLPIAVANAKVTPDNKIKVYALRVKASLFGHNASRQPKLARRRRMEGEEKHYTLTDPPTMQNTWGSQLPPDRKTILMNVVLDAVHDQIKPGSLVAIDWSAGRKPERVITIRSVDSVRSLSLDVLSIATRVSVLTVDKSWFDLKVFKDQANNPTDPTDFLRNTNVYAQSELLELAEEPIDTPIGDANSDIELDRLYNGLQSGRWLIIYGERTDIQDADKNIIPGVKTSELIMLSSVTQGVKQIESGGDKKQIDLLGDKTHTFIRLSGDLAYRYKRDTVTIYGNVVKATHGETRKEVLGSGDGSKALQTFALRQPPLTYVAATTPAGVESTLKLYVNEVQWHEAESLVALSPTDRHFITRTDDEGKAAVIFGNGENGTRLPTGSENVKAVYRNGIGKPGNVKAEQISLLMSRPLGVKEVINPLPATGGADKENRDQARRQAPLAVMALDRLVSVQDYEDFARTFAGIGKAHAVRLSDGRREIVHVTIAGAEDIPIAETSDLFINLRQALHQFGDPYQPIQLTVRELLLLIISANVRVLPDYQWEPVVTKIRAALLDTFSFERRELGQDVLLSEVISVIQRVEGVAYVDVDAFGGIPEKTDKNGERRLITPKELLEKVQNFASAPASRVPVNMVNFEKGIRPAQIAYLTSEVPDTMILNAI